MTPSDSFIEEALEERIERALVPDEPNVDEEIAWRDENPTQAPRFVVDDESKADWALRKLQRIRQRIAANATQADRILQETKAWLDEVNAREAKHAAFFEALLAEFHLTILSKDDPGRKTIKLPAGTLSARQLPFQVQIDDERLIKWAQVHDAPHLVREKVEVARDALRKAIDMERVRDDGTAVTADGEVIEGVTVTPGGLKFSVVTEVES